MSRGYAPDWDVDLEWGESVEPYAQLIHEWLRDGDPHVLVCYEVKRKGPVDHEVFVEVEHDPQKRGEYKPSGFATTKAHIGVWVVNDTGNLLAFTVPLIRWAIEQRELAGERPINGGRDGDNPTKGYLMDARWLLQQPSHIKGTGFPWSLECPEGRSEPETEFFRGFGPDQPCSPWCCRIRNRRDPPEE